jgi:hypothetical protein
MRSTRLQQALDLALELPAADRAALAHELLTSLDGPTDTDAAQAWEAEIALRLEQLERGVAQTINRTELRKLMRERLRRL